MNNGDQQPTNYAERLRLISMHQAHGSLQRDIQDAANELERLQKMVEGWRRSSDHNAHVANEFRKRIIELGAEIARLRAEIKELKGA